MNGEDRPTSTAPDPVERPVDPRTIRVALAPSSAHADRPPMIVAPAPVPVAPVPSVVGRGPLGGVASIRAQHGPESAPGAVAADHAVAREVLVDGDPAQVAVRILGPGRAIVTTTGTGEPAARVLLEPPAAVPDGRGTVRRELIIDGWRIEVDIESERRAALRDRARRGREASAHGGPTEVHAIIPGRVVSVSVAPGEAVVAGQQLLVVEAMKMQNELRAPRDGVVSRVSVAPGVTIEIGDLLLVLE